MTLPQKLRHMVTSYVEMWGEWECWKCVGMWGEWGSVFECGGEVRKMWIGVWGVWYRCKKCAGV